jgi:penicillin amidase
MSLTNDATGTPLEREERGRLAALRSGPDTESRLLTREDADRPIADAPRTRRGRRFLRRLLLAWLTILVIVAGLAAAGAIWSRHVMRAVLPTIDGTLPVDGLRAPVTVARNPQGVPSLHASSMEDLLFAQGYVTAQDRLWQMDTLRRHAAGELAEILGPGLVLHDEMQRYLQLRAAADRAAASLPPDKARELEAYSRGVNAFIESHRDRLPLEFHLLHYTPRRWTPRDSLLVSLVMWQDLSTSFPHKLDRELLARHLPHTLLADLYPVGSWRDHPPTQPPSDLTTPREIEEIPLDKTQSRVQPPSIFANPEDLLAITNATTACTGCRAGSNNWAVSGARSASGKPLVSNDMHLSLRVPDIWYEAALHRSATPDGVPPADVVGFTLPGLPWVIVGRNAHVAWSFTNLGGDVQDVRVEHTRGSNSSLQYQQADGTWSPIQHHTEQIIVRGGHDVSLDVLTVLHVAGTGMMESPVVTPMIPSEHRTISLAWTIYDPACVDNSLLAADSATDGSSLIAGFANFGGPSLNLIYGDDQGHIGYHAIGRIPVRGPALQHPHSKPAFVLPAPEPEFEEDESDGSTPSPPAALETAPRKQPIPRPKIDHSQPQIAPEQTGSYTIGSPISPTPVDALDESQIWSGYVPYNELPAIQDPVSGIVATANARITTDDYPYALTEEWIDPYRVERIYRLLHSRSTWTPQQMLGVQLDQYSAFDLLLAQKLAYAIDHSSATARGSDSTRLRQAADLLRTWTGEMSATSPAAAIVAAARDSLWSALLVPQIIAHDGGSGADAIRFARLYSWGESNTALEGLLEHMPKRWLPHGVPNWNDFLTSAVEEGLGEAHAPRDLPKWQYGSIHRIEIEHPLFGGRPYLNWLLGAATGSGAQPAGGGPTTIDSIGVSFGPSERFTADLSSASETIANIVTGESGNVSSPWYLDQFQPWLRGFTFSLPLDNDHAEHSLTLVPSH